MTYIPPSEMKNLLPCLLGTLPEERLLLSALYAMMVTLDEENHLSQGQVLFPGLTLK